MAISSPFSLSQCFSSPVLPSRSTLSHMGPTHLSLSLLLGDNWPSVVLLFAFWGLAVTQLLGLFDLTASSEPHHGHCLPLGSLSVGVSSPPEDTPDLGGPCSLSVWRSKPRNTALGGELGRAKPLTLQSGSELQHNAALARHQRTLFPPGRLANRSQMRT